MSEQKMTDEQKMKDYMAAKMKHIKMYNECMNLADGLDVEKFAELVRADERKAHDNWVGLTRSEAAALWADAHDIDGKMIWTPSQLFAEIDRRLRERNT